MKSKKLVSAITALTLIASTFFCVSLNVEAATKTVSVYSKDFSTMSATAGATEKGNWSIVNPNNDGGTKAVSFIENSGIQYKHNTRNNSSYAKSSIGLADGIITLTGTWNTGSSNSAYGNDVYLSFNDADGNTAFAILSQYNDKALYLQVGNTTTYTTLAKNDNIRNNVTTEDDLSFTAVYDTETKILSSISIVTNVGTYTKSSLSSEAGAISEVRIGCLMDGTDPKGRKDMYSTIKALNVTKEVEIVPTSISINGTDSVTSGGTADYSAKVLDQDGEECDDATLSLQNTVEGVTLTGNTLSVDSTVSAGTEITLVASYNGLTDVTKTVTVTSNVGYILKTTPYSIVTVDGTDYNSGYTGAVQFPVGTTGEKVVTITKSGYSDRTESVTFADNQDGTYNLTPSETGVTYYEDFTNVNDSMGNTSASTTIDSTNGLLKYVVANSDMTGEITLPGTQDIADKLVTLDISAYTVNGNNRFTFRILGNGFNSTFNTDGKCQWRVHNTGFYSAAVTNSNTLTEYHKLQMYFVSTRQSYGDATLNGRVLMYMDGKYIGYVGGLYDYTMSGLQLSANNYNSGYKTRANIKSITISSKPTDVNVTITNGLGDTTTTTATYIAGSKVTLPAATTVEGYAFAGWSDGTKTYNEGETVTVDSDVTYTAQYEQIVPKLVLTEKSAFATETGATGTVRFSTTVDNKLNWDNENSTLTGIGYAIVNVNDWSTISTKMSEFAGTDYIDKSGRTSIELGSDKPFFYEIHGISPEIHGVKFYAVPYLIYNINSASTTFWGAPITHASEFDWNTTNAAKLDSTIEHTAKGSN